jgi:hypothetical protein
MTTVEQLARWLEEDGHSGCASDLLTARPEDRLRVARAAADCAENDLDAYGDDIARHLPDQLREWAAGHQGQPPV